MPFSIQSFRMSSLFIVGIGLQACEEEKTINQPPSTPVISIDPATPFAGSDLQLVFDTPSIDPEGDEVTYQYQWSLNGEEQTDLTVDFVSGDRVSGGQVWSVRVTPLDASNTGEAATALTTVANSSPEIDLSISPELPRTTDDLSLIYSVSDADNDEIEVVINWLKDEAETGVSEETVAAGLTARGEVWTANVTVSDTNQAEETFSVQVEIQNSPPEVVSIEPSVDASKESVLMASVLAADVDDDDIFITYIWTVNDVIVQEGSQPVDVYDCNENQCCDAAGVPLETCHHQLPSNLYSKNDIVTLEAFPMDDADSGESVNHEWTIGNSAPTIDSAVINPTIPLYGDVVTCTHEGFLDLDSDLDMSQIKWFYNGAEVGNDSSLNLIDIGAVHGDVIRCEATPYDGFDFGGLQSAEVVLGNTPPVIDAVSLTPTSPSRSASIVCNVDSSSDVDQEPIVSYSYSWFADGNDLGIDADSLEPIYFSKNQSVNCAVSAFDGTDYGPVTSSAASLVANALPSITSISVSPSFATSGSILSCSYSGFNDPDPNDTDQSITEWYSQGQLIQTGAMFDVSANGLARGDMVACKVTPYDGFDFGAPFFKNMPIGNAAPVISNVTLSPNPATTNDVLTVTADVVDLEGDAFTISYKWYVDGIYYSTVTGNTFDGSLYFDKHQQVYVEIQADDQIGISTVSTPVITVSNTPPIAPEIAFEPYNPFPDDNLKCVVSNQTPDDDLDPLTYSVEWTRNGQPYTGPTVTDDVLNDTIEWTDTVLNDTWECFMTVADDDGDINLVSSEISICPQGHDPICAPESCDDIIQTGYADLDRDGNNDDDLFYINPTGTAVIQAFCDMNANDGGWTLLLTADGHSTYWGNNASSWATMGQDAAPTALAEEDLHLSTYQDLTTNEIKICHTTTQFCYVFDHGLDISLYAFFANGISHVDYSYNNTNYADVGGSDVLGNYETGLGYNYYTGTCRWLGINHVETSSGIGLLADDDNACSGSLNPGHYDDIAFGIGMQSCDDGNGCALGGSSPAGQQRGLQPQSSPILSPWMVFGR